MSALTPIQQAYNLIRGRIEAVPGEHADSDEYPLGYGRGLEAALEVLEQGDPEANAWGRSLRSSAATRWTR
jgi:hypothetical protein